MNLFLVRDKKEASTCPCAVTLKDAQWAMDKLNQVDFAKIDKDDKGFIDLDSFHVFFGALGLSKTRTRLLF